METNENENGADNDVATKILNKEGNCVDTMEKMENINTGKNKIHLQKV